ncbi:hypothetical protein CAI21_05020 [Alkalilimnicola ehrlichii]|uniref:virulence factor BrkB family protein n=1 Tax=Alkalilimnicola ehrlichii TaxID=351052 RepID=UPI000E2F7DCD|nr:virulence factor BrkB family protein [Alkalilimnicola ehrlichii]RFA30439.1 hypothetical protein CAI21_05020 [Alkalilimnicola ehrlichii]
MIFGVRNVGATLARLTDRQQWYYWLCEWRNFAIYLSRRVVHDNCLQNAATLAYTTLLSIVPLLAVGFSVLAAFPVFEPLVDQVRTVIFTNLVPATGEVVSDYIEHFISQAAGLTVAGIAGLLVSALLLMSAIDKALNDIWSVRNRRRPLYGFMVYWTVLTLSPLLIGVAVLASTYVGTLSAELARGPRQLLASVTPFLAQAAIFTFLYSAVPNRRVPLSHAVIGALLASFMFEIAKGGFAWYVAAFPTFEVIYGALATLPLFLVWVYVSWIILLTGAEFTQALSGYRNNRPGALGDPAMEFTLTVHLLGHLWQAQREGRTVSLKQLVAREPDAGETALQRVLQHLESARIVQRTAQGNWVFARDPNSFTLLDVYRSYPVVLPEAQQCRVDSDADQRLAALLKPVDRSLEESLAVPVAEVFLTGSVSVHESLSAFFYSR